MIKRQACEAGDDGPCETLKAPLAESSAQASARSWAAASIIAPPSLGDFQSFERATSLTIKNWPVEAVADLEPLG